jgi:hypothetical protein
VTGDPRLAASLVTNLVDNALRHNIAGGTVEITTTGAGRLTVSNTGDPIPRPRSAACSNRSNGWAATAPTRPTATAWASRSSPPSPTRTAPR